MKVLRTPEAFPLRGLGPPRTERVRGWLRQENPGRENAVNYFRFGRTRVCITPISLHRVKIIGFLGNDLQQAVLSYIHVYMYYISAVIFSLACKSRQAFFSVCFVDYSNKIFYKMFFQKKVLLYTNSSIYGVYIYFEVYVF